MTDRIQLVYLKTRLLNKAAEKWHVPMQELSDMFHQYGIYKYIEDCYDMLSAEGDNAALFAISAVLKSRGADITKANKDREKL